MTIFPKILSVLLTIYLTITCVAAAEIDTPCAGTEASDSISIAGHYVPLYFQTDYPDTRYGHGTVATSGCGITSLAMVATYLTGHDYYPDELIGRITAAKYRKEENTMKKGDVTHSYSSHVDTIVVEPAKDWDECSVCGATK